MCSFVPKGMEGYRGTWMEGIENSIGSGENRNCEVCMGMCVCPS